MVSETIKKSIIASSVGFIALESLHYFFCHKHKISPVPSGEL